MNYQKLHDAIVANARQFPPIGRHEVHHIIPRSIGGLDTPENIIAVTYRQHFILHWLLTKINPDSSKLCYAFHMLSHQSSYSKRPQDEVLKRINSRAYANNKIRMAELLSERMKDVPKTIDHKEKIRLAAIARWQRPGEKEKQAIRSLGNKNSLGIKRGPRTIEQKQKQSKAMNQWFLNNESPLKGKPKSPESIAKMKETKRLNPRVFTEEEKKAAAARQLGKRRSPYQKKKAADANAAKWEITTPTNETLLVWNLRQFCRNHHLSQGSLLTHGHTKGYKARKLNN